MNSIDIATAALVAVTSLLTALCVRHARRNWFRNPNH